MMPSPDLSARYRAWAAAAGPWAGYFRAVPLVALARGAAPFDAKLSRRVLAAAERLAAQVVAAGQAEGWLGRPAVLLLLDLPGAASVLVSRRLGAHGVQPVVVAFQWPGPRAHVPSQALLAALWRESPHQPPPPEAQYAFVLDRDRAARSSRRADPRRFDNRYQLGSVDLPSPERLREEGVQAIVVCRSAPLPLAADLAAYSEQLIRAGWPVRDLPLAPPAMVAR